MAVLTVLKTFGWLPAPIACPTIIEIPTDKPINSPTRIKNMVDEKLKAAKVMLLTAERQGEIEAAASAAATEEGLRVTTDDRLLEEVAGLGHHRASNVHLLLGLMKVDDSVAGQVLESFGAGVESARHEVLEFVAECDGGAP